MQAPADDFCCQNVLHNFEQTSNIPTTLLQQIDCHITRIDFSRKEDMLHKGKDFHLQLYTTHYTTIIAVRPN